MEEFFGFGGYSRAPEGYLSWQHLVFVTALILAAVLLAVILGRRNRNRSPREKNRVLVAAAILIDLLEIAKIVLLCLRSQSTDCLKHNLPLFLCSIQLIALPLAAFSRGRLKEAALDFVSIFGVLGMVLGMYGAGQNYNAYPVLSLDNVASGLTHSISGFAALYILISGLASLKKRNIWLSCAILLGFCAVAYAADLLIPYNYMFLMRHDGTPYVIVWRLIYGDTEQVSLPLAYSAAVVGLFLLYIAAFYSVCYLVRRRANSHDQIQ